MIQHDFIPAIPGELQVAILGLFVDYRVFIDGPARVIPSLSVLHALSGLLISL